MLGRRGAEYVDFTTGERPLVQLTAQGRSVMKGERAARLLLPARAVSRAPGGGARRATTGVPRVEDPQHLDAAATRLFEALRDKRLKLARAQHVPPYVIASDRSLREIALLRPGSVDELLQVYGVGAAKAQKYGRVWLELVAADTREGP